MVRIGRAAALLALAVAIFLGSCSRLVLKRGGHWPPHVEEALRKAGDNRAELEKVLEHYEQEGDSLKLEAAYFLISNMEGHSFARLVYYDSTGAEYDFDVMEFPDYETLRDSVNRIERRVGSLDYHASEVLEDLEHMSSRLLIEHIDYAFRAWRELPWAQDLGFERFREFVLPYRGSNEPLESWRPYFMRLYSDLPEKMEDPTDPIEAAALINKDLGTWFKFDPRFYLHPTDQGLCDMLKNRLGRCEDIANLTIYALRANAIPITSDYTPYWADASNNHAWTAVIDANGHALLPEGSRREPKRYEPWNRVAKVYRKTFSRQDTNLVFIKPEWEEVPGWLRGKSYVDVTSEYTKVADVHLTLEEAVPESVNFAYLCVFNAGGWRPIHWGRLRGTEVTFKGMGVGIAYLPAYYVKGEVKPASPPFILENDGSVRPLPGRGEPIRLHLVSTTRRKQLVDTDGVEKAFFEDGKKYTLYYWDGDWKEVGSQVAEGGPLDFDGVPGGALYWLTEENSYGEERIFTYEEGHQVWW